LRIAKRNHWLSIVSLPFEIHNKKATKKIKNPKFFHLCDILEAIFVVLAVLRKTQKKQTTSTRLRKYCHLINKANNSSHTHKQQNCSPRSQQVDCLRRPSDAEFREIPSPRPARQATGAA
jgi:hypothetical protein